MYAAVSASRIWLCAMVEFAESLTIAQTHNLIQKQPQTLKEK
jgi:hypothetical protein